MWKQMMQQLVKYKIDLKIVLLFLKALYGLAPLQVNFCSF